MMVPAGSPIPINCQLWDGNNSVFVKAFLTSENGTPYSPASVNLTNAGHGLYLNTSLNMPPSGVIFASLFVYSDSGYTQLDNNYTITADTFSVATGGGGGGSGGGVSSPVVGYIVNQTPIVGIVENNQAVGELQNTALTGQIENNQTVGEVAITPVTGKIEC